MPQQTTVTIETAFQIDLEVPNRMSRIAVLEKAAQYILILAALQMVSIFGCARQSAQVHTLKPEEIPETITYYDYEVATVSGIPGLCPQFTWKSSYPVRCTFTWRIAGGSWATPHDYDPDERPLTLDHIAEIDGTWDDELTYEFKAIGMDINGNYHYGDPIPFIWNGVVFSIVEE